ncbi:hypothetical protein [Bacillus]|uniref:hypothetical protein n=1 Tax=Bacillus TaxID=1386 RepID=UPI0004E41DB1|nr:hypothetical protein [Bacillus]WIT27175.1 hypothetical protein [Bacillus phage SPbetaL2]AWX22004.1 hypothetical protein CXF51_10830 [Bacillus subtilis subsp. subtilis]KAA0936998.1 hypothetical protein FQ086_05310 [Bacillus sp. ANT_WA51]KFC32378.1 hypothetical protein ZQL_05450 [Bacillus subtilis]KIN34086.1 hypothetical protein B4068_2048 [Bacillus subtilis]
MKLKPSSIFNKEYNDEATYCHDVDRLKTNLSTSALSLLLFIADFCDSNSYIEYSDLLKVHPYPSKVSENLNELLENGYVLVIHKI